jgi:hypothetical protein
LCGCGGQDCCPPGNSFYATAEYLVWSIKGAALPALAIVNPNPLFSPAGGPPFSGALGTQGTSVVIGNNSVGAGARSGLRGTVGYWLSDDHLLGVEVGGFFLGEKDNNFHAASTGTTLLGRPFFNSNPLAPSPAFQFTAGVFNPGMGLTPQLVAGSVDVKLSSTLWGVEANARSNILCGPNFTLDLLAGFREVGLDETLTIRESIQVLGAAAPTAAPAFQVPPGTTVLVNDRFSTHNRFYGPQVGADAEFHFFDHWSLGLKAKFAMGTTMQQVSISGDTTVNMPTPMGTLTNTTAGGLLTQSTNLGRFTRSTFSVMPEVGVNVGYQWNDHVRLFAGYNVLYWSDVVRPGNQIDPSVDARLLNRTVPANQLVPPPTNPTFRFHNTDLWVQGVTLGVEFRY